MVKELKEDVVKLIAKHNLKFVHITENNDKTRGFKVEAETQDGVIALFDVDKDGSVIKWWL